MLKALCVLLVAMLLVSGCSRSTGDCTSVETFCGPQPDEPESQYADSEGGWLNGEGCHDEYEDDCHHDEDAW